MASIRQTLSLLKKAFIQNLKTGETIPVLFNPGEYTQDKSNNFASIEIPGREAPLLQFIRGDMQTLSMDLFFDTYDAMNPIKKDVRDYTRKIMKLMAINSSLHAPPVLKFVWGSLSFTCVLQKATQKFTMFTTGGVPVRATISVTFNEYQTEKTAMGTHLESRDRTAHHVVTQGDTLWKLAWEEYGDASLWRHIADANNITDARKLTPGQSLSIPAIE